MLARSCLKSKHSIDVVSFEKLKNVGFSLSVLHEISNSKGGEVGECLGDPKSFPAKRRRLFSPQWSPLPSGSMLSAHPPLPTPLYSHHRIGLHSTTLEPTPSFYPLSSRLSPHFILPS